LVHPILWLVAPQQSQRPSSDDIAKVIMFFVIPSNFIIILNIFAKY